MSIKGFNIFDEQGNVVGTEKYDYNSLDGKPELQKESSKASLLCTVVEETEDGKVKEQKRVVDPNIYKTEEEGQLHVSSLEIGSVILTDNPDKQAFVIGFKN